MRASTHRPAVEYVVVCMVGAIAAGSAMASFQPSARQLLALALIPLGVAIGLTQIELFIVVVYFVSQNVINFMDVGIPLGGGRLLTSDLLLAAVWVIGLRRRLSIRGTPHRASAPSAISMLILISIVWSAVLLGLSTLLMGGDLNLAIRGFRPFLYLSMFFPLSFCLEDTDRVHRTASWLMGAGAALAAVGLVLYLAGISFGKEGNYASWDKTPLLYYWGTYPNVSAIPGIYRLMLPFYGLLTLVLCWSIPLITQRRHRLQAAMARVWLGLAPVAILLSFIRALWAGSLVACLFALGMLRQLRRWLLVAGAAVVCLVLVSGSVLASGTRARDLAQALVGRAIEGVAYLQYREGTFGARLDLINYDLIRSNLVYGVGFYYGTTPTPDPAYAITDHNLYADFALRFGIIGLAWLVLLLVVTIHESRAVLAAAGPTDTRSIIAVGCSAAVLGKLVYGVSSSDWLHSYGTIELVLILAMLDVLRSQIGHTAAAEEAARDES